VINSSQQNEMNRVPAEQVTTARATTTPRQEHAAGRESSMSTIDASKCWRIMPFLLFDGGKEWWVLGPDNKTVDGARPARSVPRARARVLGLGRTRELS
jgi:hypothetical protein